MQGAARSGRYPAGVKTPVKSGGGGPPKQGARDRAGRFRAGASGNPLGRPPGSGSRARFSALGLPVVESASDVLAASSALVSAAADGRLGVKESREFMKLLDLHRRAIETHELAGRVAALEGASA